MKRPRPAPTPGVDWALGAALGFGRWMLRPVGRIPDDADAVAVVQPPAGWEVWSRITDWLLIGPDAGAWAQAARSARDGELIDAFRLPVYPRLTAAVPVEDLVVAGHLVNHACAALTVAATCVLGTRLGGRAVGIVAAVLVGLAPSLTSASALYGVDPTVQAASALWFVATWTAVQQGGFWRTCAAGVSGGVLLASHYLGLIIVGAGLPLLALGRRGWPARLLAPLVALGAALPVAARLLRDQEVLPNLTLVMGVYGTGVLGEAGAPDAQQQLFTRAVDFVQQGLPGALVPAVDLALADLNHGGVWPQLLGFALWSGMLAPRGKDLRPALFLTMGLAPLVLLTAAEAPERYAGYALPLVMVAVSRALVGPAGWLGERLHRWGRGGGQLLAGGLVLGLLVPGQLRQAPGPPSTLRVVQDFRAARALLAASPEPTQGEAGGVITRSQTIPLLSSRTQCPLQRCTGGAEDPLTACLSRVLLECPGQGDIPYVHEITEVFGPGDARSDRLLSYVQDTFSVAWHDSTPDRTVQIYWLQRSVLQGLTGPVRRGPEPPKPPRRWSWFGSPRAAHAAGTPAGSNGGIPAAPKPQFGVVPPAEPPKTQQGPPPPKR